MNPMGICVKQKTAKKQPDNEKTEKPTIMTKCSAGSTNLTQIWHKFAINWHFVDNFYILPQICAKYHVILGFYRNFVPDFSDFT